MSVVGYVNTIANSFTGRAAGNTLRFVCTLASELPTGSDTIDGDSAYAIDTGFRYEDLVAAVDVVVTKPGYGILSECISANRPMLYTSRGQFREYDVLVREMPKYIRCRFIEQPALMSGSWQGTINALLAQPPAPETMALNGAAVAARLISDLLDASRSG